MTLTWGAPAALWLLLGVPLVWLADLVARTNFNPRQRLLQKAVRSLLLAAPAAALLGARSGRAAPDPATHLTASMLEQGPPTLHNPMLLVAGPADAAPGLWATLLAPRLTDALQAGAAVTV